jgi:phosphate-selective porin
MKLHTKLIFSSLLILLSLTTNAQENTAPDSVNLQLQQMQSVLNTLSKIKISGYIQAQFQAVNALGASTFEGGNFSQNSATRFMVRRGRLKMQHTGKVSLLVLQLDATERGVGIKDAYVTLTEPWINSISLTMGVFDRPFGYEITYSSSLRESPERGRMSQILFPGERDLGAMISFQPPLMSAIKFLRIDAALVNGNGIAQEFDNYKDFIGRIRLNNIINREAVNFSIGGSHYNGAWKQSTVTKYEIGINTVGASSFLAGPGLGKSGYVAPRKYYGTDAQLSLKWLAGTTTLRGEYIFGIQSGLVNSTTSPSSAFQPTGSAYIRNFDGAYFYFVQNILESGHQLVVKYDWYDPNTDVEGNEIGGPGNNLGFAEIKFQSLGFGWNYHLTNNLRFMAFYQVVKNENTNTTPYHEDVKDDVLTLRLQHKF